MHGLDDTAGLLQGLLHARRQLVGSCKEKLHQPILDLDDVRASRLTILAEVRGFDAKQRRAPSAPQADAVVSTAAFVPFETPVRAFSLSPEVVVEKLVVPSVAQGDVAAAQLLHETPKWVLLANLRPRV